MLISKKIPQERMTQCGHTLVTSLSVLSTFISVYAVATVMYNPVETYHNKKIDTFIYFDSKWIGILKMDRHTYFENRSFEKQSMCA